MVSLLVLQDLSVDDMDISADRLHLSVLSSLKTVQN